MPPDPGAEKAPLIIAKFDKALHDRSAFECGFAPIDNFLKSSLSEQIRDGMVAAYVATERGEQDVLGFYTLGAMAVRAELGPKQWQRARVPDVPVIYLRAVAVHKTEQGRGLGTALLIDAMRRCMTIADQMGATAIVLDVLKDDAFDRRARFYADLGFRDMNDPDNPTRVFIPMVDVRATLGDSS